MTDHPIEGLMRTAMENLKEMVDVNTIVGDPVETPDGSVIMPVTRVGFGFAAGGSEFMKNGSSDPAMDHPFGGGSGGGVSITPIAFLIVNSKGVKMVHMDESTHLYEKLLEFTPQVVEKIQDMLKGNGNQNNQNNGQNPPGQTPPI
ncbi:GerW family sporulation protein [Alteribacillus bidgolensis]|uniref:Sporulation protein YtfJ n=1 Tax=Alteribacillus bidgolensis TaxID=930129 RepID=A0A1G8EUX4_9BACI|nr:GerW family sporulation protein [Alteribacillus bidgolensis]SDH73711.1 sporulation protein YtfJ [Alteribacillus bidgolensis]